ncbi:unnamed protein product [Calypogeia fissa]
MALRQFSSSAIRRLDLLLWGSGRCHKALACWERNVSTANLGPEPRRKPRLNVAAGQFGKFGIAFSRVELGHFRSVHNQMGKLADRCKIS